MQLYRYPQTDLNQQNLDWMVNTIKELQERIASGSSGIAVITSSADMTDVTMIYIYRGSEVGYNYDHWYYWDAGITSWVDGGAWGMDMSLLPLSIANGGTGSATAADARTALGITPANIGAVATTDLPLAINKGGTGKTTPAAARTALGITPANIGAVPVTDLPLSVANGGTGASTPSAAAANLLTIAMGKGAFSVLSGTDADSIVDPGTYAVTTAVAVSMANYPATDGGVMYVYNAVGDNKIPGDSYYYVRQDVYDLNGKHWHRVGTSGSGSTVIFGSWNPDFEESGSNAYGSYSKLPDGTLIQRGEYIFNDAGTMTQIGTSGIYSTAVKSVQLPLAFASGDYSITASSRYATGNVLPAGTMKDTSTAFVVEAFDFYARPTNDGKLKCDWLAIGRWY